ncbi:hypothetical protein A6J42_20660 (plasmid) [Leptospira interrogans serovar Copenhageni]|nr:hypothetical protein A6J42_20660 [Leptospira interrogans serovar Copenhageni]
MYEILHFLNLSVRYRFVVVPTKLKLLLFGYMKVTLKINDQFCKEVGVVLKIVSSSESFFFKKSYIFEQTSLS